MLNQEQVTSFKESGYVKINNWLTTDEVNAMFRQISLLSAAYPELVLTEKSRIEEGKLLPFQVRCFVSQSTWFGDWLSNERLNAELTQLMGEKCSMLVDSFKLKYPGGGDFHAHQDMQGPIIKHLNTTREEHRSPKITRLVTMCIAFDEHTTDNGCLEVATSQHKDGWLGESGENIGTAAVQQLTFAPITMNAGDLMYFDGFLPHRSDINKSQSTRRALFLFFNALSEGSHYERVLKFTGLQ